jgi:metal-sulfur cluster biosynthetic enzyme
MDERHEQVMAALSTVIEPELHRDIVSLNMVRDLTIEGDTAKFTLVLTTPACPLKNVFEDRCNAAVIGRAPGIQRLEIKAAWAKVRWRRIWRRRWLRRGPGWV